MLLWPLCPLALRKSSKISSTGKLLVPGTASRRVFHAIDILKLQIDKSSLYCWWKKSGQPFEEKVVYPVIYKVFYLPGGAGFQTSTVFEWSEKEATILQVLIIVQVRKREFINFIEKIPCDLEDSGAL